jgi:hypothetical protein
VYCDRSLDLEPAGAVAVEHHAPGRAQAVLGAWKEKNILGETFLGEPDPTFKDPDLGFGRARNGDRLTRIEGQIK